MEHALDCRTEGLVIQWHKMLWETWPQLCTKKPVVREADDKNNVQALIADLGVHGC